MASRSPFLPLLLAFAVLGLGPRPASAQGPGRYPVRNFGFQQGLQNLSVNALAQDRDGFIWAGTEAGVFRFDGRRFERVDLPGISRFVNALLASPSGTLWVGTRDGLGNRPGPGQAPVQATGLPSGPITHLGQGPTGELWALHASGPFRSSDHRRFDPAPGWPAGESANSLFALPEDPEILVAGNGKLWTFRPADGTWQGESLPLPNSNQVLQSISRDGDGFLWARSSDRLLVKAPGRDAWSRVVHEGLRGAPDRPNISRDREGFVWVNTEQGLLRGRRGRLEFLEWKGNSSNTTASLVDQEGGWWTGSVGVFHVLGKNLWKNHDLGTGLPSNVVWGVRRDRQGRLWAATDGGLAVGTPRGWRTVHKGQISRLSLGPDGSLFAVGTPGGVVYRIPPGNERPEEIRVDILPPSPISRGLAIEADGSVWISDFQDGLAHGRRHGGRWIWEKGLVDGAAPKNIWHVLQDFRGNIFLGTRDGLYLRTGGAWERVKGTLPHTPYSALRSASGDVWAFYFDRPVLTRHRRGPGGWERVEEWAPFPGNNDLVVYSQTEDAKGKLWLGTSHGLVRLDPGLRQIERWYSPGEGIPGADATNQGILLEPDGRLWLGTTEGLGEFQSTAEPPSTPLPMPVLLEWSSLGKALDPVAPDGEIHPGADLEARFAVNAFSMPGRLILQARIPGVDSDWIPLEKFQVRYAALPQGSYRLQARTFLLPATPGPILELPFTVQPHWWQRGWAVLLGLLVLGAATWFGAHLYDRRLRARNLELQEMVADRTAELQELNGRLLAAKERADQASQAKSTFLSAMSHEFRTPLSAIMLYSELLQEAARERGDAKQVEDHERILGSGRHLLALLNGILDLAKIEAGKMDLDLEPLSAQAVLEEVAGTLQPLADKGANALVVEAPEPSLRFQCDATKLRQILINLGSNACRFTQGGKILLAARPEGGAMVFRVEDTGIGMSQEEAVRVFEPFEQAGPGTRKAYGGTGLGLTLSLGLARFLGGTLTVDSTPGEGTRFTLRLPLDGPSR